MEERGSWLDPQTQEMLQHEPQGGRFLEQFLGIPETDAEARRFPMHLRMFYKKARIMAHWGSRIGAEVRVGSAQE